jgi:hypothetical protein
VPKLVLGRPTAAGPGLRRKGLPRLAWLADHAEATVVSLDVVNVHLERPEPPFAHLTLVVELHAFYLPTRVASASNEWSCSVMGHCPRWSGPGSGCCAYRSVIRPAQTARLSRPSAPSLSRALGLIRLRVNAANSTACRCLRNRPGALRSKRLGSQAANLRLGKLRGIIPQVGLAPSRAIAIGRGRTAPHDRMATCGLPFNLPHRFRVCFLCHAGPSRLRFRRSGGQAGSPSASALRTMPSSVSADRYPQFLSAWVSIHLRELVRAVAIS